VPGSHYSRVEKLERSGETPNQGGENAYGQSPEEIREQFFEGLEKTAQRGAELVDVYRRGVPVPGPHERGLSNGEIFSHGLALAYLGRDDEARELLGLDKEEVPTTNRREKALQAITRVAGELTAQKFVELMEEREVADG